MPDKMDKAIELIRCHYLTNMSFPLLIVLNLEAKGIIKSEILVAITNIIFVAVSYINLSFSKSLFSLASDTSFQKILSIEATASIDRAQICWAKAK